MFSMLKDDIKSASEYEQAFTRFKQLNLGDAVNNDATAFAKSTDQFEVAVARFKQLGLGDAINGQVTEFAQSVHAFASLLSS